MPADEVEHGDPQAEKSVEAFVGDPSPQLKAEQIQEDPRNDGEVVGRIKAVRRKSEEGEPSESVYRFGKPDQRIAEQSDEAVWDAVQQHEQEEKDQHTDQGLDTAELTAQGEGDQHRAAQQIENAEPDRLLGHDQHRDDRDQKTAEVGDDAVPVTVARKVHRHTGYDIEEFFHGIYNSITEDSYLFYLASKGDYKERTEKLIEILGEWTPHNYLIGSPDGIRCISDRYCLVDFTEDPLFSCWEYIIPLQIVSCRAAADLGRNPDIPKDPNFHARIGSKDLDGIRDHYEADPS